MRVLVASAVLVVSCTRTTAFLLPSGGHPGSVGQGGWTPRLSPQGHGSVSWGLHRLGLGTGVQQSTVLPDVSVNVTSSAAAEGGDGSGRDTSLLKQPIGRREAALALTATVEALRAVQGDGREVEAGEELRPFYELAQRCRRSNMPDMVLEVLNTYRRVASPQGSGPPINATSDLWTLIIAAHAELGDVALSARTLEDAIRNGRMVLVPGCRTSSWRVGRILEALVSSSAAGLVMGLHLKAQLEEAGLLPDFSFYPALLDALWRWGPFVERDAMTDGDYTSELAVVTLFPDRRPGGGGSTNSSDLDGIAASLLSPSRSRQLSLDVYHQVAREGFKLNNGLKAALVRCFYRSSVGLNASRVGAEWSTERMQRMEGALQAARDVMSAYNISWSTAVASGLLQECLRVNHTEGAASVLKTMIKSNVSADLGTFNGLLRVYSEAGDAATCQSLLQAMKENKLNPRPDGLTYALVAEAFLNARTNITQASKVLQQAKSAGVAPCAELWRARLRHHVLTRPSDPLEPLLREADSAAFPLSASVLSSLLDTYAQAGNLDGATSLFSSLRWPKFNVPADHVSLVLPPPTRTVYTSMISSFCLHGRYPVAITLLKRMQSRAQPYLLPWQLEAMTPSRHGYTTVIKGAVDAGDTLAALQMVKFMEAQGVSPSQAALIHILRGFGQEKDVNAAMGVWLELRAAYQPPCRAAFEVMISACMTQPSGLEPALRVLSDMRSCGFDLDRMYYRPFMDLLGYDAIVMQNVLEPFRQNVGLIEVDDEELAALMFACMRNGMTPEQSSRRLNALGVGLPAVTMIYLRLDQPKSSAIMERKSVLNNYEMRSTMGELGWLSLDSEYEQPTISAARYEEFTRLLTSTMKTLRQQQQLAIGKAGKKGAPEPAAGAREPEGSGSKSGSDVGRMVARNKADRREAQISRRERQLQKLKERGPPVMPTATTQVGSGTAPSGPVRQGVKDQRDKARKLLGATTTTTAQPKPPAAAAKSSPSSSSSSSSGGSSTPFRAGKAPASAPKRSSTPTTAAE